MTVNPNSTRQNTSRARSGLAIAVYLVIAFGLSWLVALPLWLGGKGLGDPLFGVVAVAMMATPAIAALIVVFTIERPQHKAQTLGLWPLRPAGRFLAYLGLGFIVPVTLVFAALITGALLGVYPADFATFSAFRELLNTQLSGSALPVPIGVLVASQFLNIAIGALLNLIPALGEELGWRGWLLPKLMPMGAVPAILVSGVIWGLWHAPLILLGYNYPTAPGWLGVLMMVGMCVLVGGVFGWLRIRSQSVWPAALAHGAFNASTGLAVVFAKADQNVDTVHATILGWSGWIVPLVLVVVFVLNRQFRKPDAAAAAARQRRSFF